ncbi:uncharacterized protein BJ171DRAFT_597586 [Polychytrium aggregatum]|uniref:uncharacterized protein n=1 Tax=Polychytrium aggregatum TaxID=110093 RepID=UPI0022FEB362|nr:uncharacterized protein BJ171DRAFT_597586 [Polychytrium aggregatum]KAI9206436.1 hypothetical protein BJ171DRAFT_597586 [Polychytrium aggregatum]
MFAMHAARNLLWARRVLSPTSISLRALHRSAPVHLPRADSRPRSNADDGSSSTGDPAPPSLPPSFRRVHMNRPTHDEPYKVVRVNLEKIRHYAGWQKIEILQALHAKRDQVDEAVYVYSILKDNNLVARLKYIDLHNHIHLLLQDRIRYEAEIKDAWASILKIGYAPSPELYSVMIHCANCWNNYDLAFELYEEMKAKALPISTFAYASLLDLCAKPQSGITQLQKGAEIWTDLQASTTPKDLSCFTRSISIFGALQDPRLVIAIFEEALAELEEMMRTSETRLGSTPKLFIQSPAVLKLTNSCISALVEAQQPAAAQEVFYRVFGRPQNGYLEPGTYAKPNAVTFKLLLKIALLKCDAELGHELWTDMMERGIKPDDGLFGRMISVLASAGRADEALEWIDKAMTVCNVVVGSNRHMQLQISLLRGYVHGGDLERAKGLFSELHSDKDDGTSRAPRVAYRLMMDQYVKHGDLGRMLDLMNEYQQAFPPMETDAEDAEDAPSSSGLVSAAAGMTTTNGSEGAARAAAEIWSREMLIDRLVREKGAEYVCQTHSALLTDLEMERLSKEPDGSNGSDELQESSEPGGHRGRHSRASLKPTD